MMANEAGASVAQVGRESVEFVVEVVQRVVDVGFGECLEGLAFPERSQARLVLLPELDRAREQIGELRLAEVVEAGEGVQREGTRGIPEVLIEATVPDLGF